MMDFQTHAIFPTHAVSGPPPLPKGGERIELQVPGGDRLRGVHLHPSRRGSGSGTLILGFAGNAWNSEHAAAYLHQLFPGADVIVFHYRGYRPSTGTPSAEALTADAALVYDFAVDRVSADRVVAVGFSIGTGVAAVLAGKRELDGLILVTPFDSLKAVASDMYPLLPVGLFFHHDIDAAAALKANRIPVAILAAAHDELILARRTDALRAAVPNLVFDRTIARVGHNDIYHASAFQEAMREALDVLDGD